MLGHKKNIVNIVEHLYAQSKYFFTTICNAPPCGLCHFDVLLENFDVHVWWCKDYVEGGGCIYTAIYIAVIVK